MGLDPITTSVLTAGSVVEEREQTRAARRDARRARDAEVRLQNVRAARERRQMARQARIARAQVESGAVASGTTQTSGFAGGTGGIQTQLASNLSFINQSQQLAEQQSVFAQRAADHRGRAQDVAAVRSLAFQTASLFTPG